MKDKDEFIEDQDKEFETYYEDEESKKRFPGFLLLCLITTVGVLFALGLSLSAIKILDSNETINTLISRLTGDDNKDKFIITYVENTGDYDSGDKKTSKNGSLYISSADFYSATNGGSGTVVFYEGLMLTTKNTFTSNSSTITYKIVIKNDASTSKTFNELIFNKDKDINYSLSGIKKGDKIPSGGSVTVYLTAEYKGKDNNNDNFPKTIESSSNFSFGDNNGIIHIIKADPYKSKNGGVGKVDFYEGLMLSTETTFNKPSSSVTYKITIKNDSKEAEVFTGLNYNKQDGIKYTLEGLKEGDTLASGQSVVVYLTLENDGSVEIGKPIETPVSFDFNEFGVSVQENGIYLINQFPTKDEVGKLFQGRNYVFNFTFLLGKKSAGIYYEITAVPKDGNTLDPNYVKLYLEKDGTGVDMSYRPNGRVKVFTEYEKSKYSEATGRVIHKGYITEEEAKKVELIL